MSSWIQIVTDRAVISQVLCVAAIHACSKRSVADRATNLALTPPPLTQEDKEIKHATKAAQPPPEPWRPWYRRVLSRKTGMAFLPLICIIGGEFFVFWILPKITSATVISAIWACFVVCLIQSFMNNVLYFFLGGPVKASFGRTEKEKALYRKYDTATPDAKPFFYTKRNRTVLASILSAALAAYTYHDKQNYALAIGAGMMTIAAFVSISFIKINTKALTVAGIGCLALCAVIGSIICGLFAYQRSNPSSSEEVEKKSPTFIMPDWIMLLLGVLNDMITAVPFGFLVMMSLRYDHFGPNSAPQLGQDKGAPGEALLVPASIPSRRSPMYKIALASTIASFAFSNFIVHYLISIGKLTVKKDGRDVTGEREELWNVIKLFAFGTCNLVVPSALALGAWMRSDFASWWAYHEEWVPKEEDEEQVEINDAEKLLLIDAEKAPLPASQAEERV